MNELELYINALKQARDSAEVQVCKLTVALSASQSENEQLKKLVWEQQQSQPVRQTEAPAPTAQPPVSESPKPQE